MNQNQRVVEAIRELFEAANVGLVTRADLDRLERRIDELEGLLDELEERLQTRAQEPPED